MIALTGSNGMTGKHMKALLISEGIPCLEVDRSLWDLSVWLSLEAMDELFEPCDAVFHFGATVPTNASNADGSFDDARLIFDVNIRSVQALAAWATLRDKPLVFISGATVYKDPHQRQIPEDAEKVVYGFGGFYGYSKCLAESLLEHYRAQGLKLVTLRPSSIYGSGMKSDRLVGKFVSLAKRGGTLTVNTPLENSINLIHCADVASAALDAYRNKSWGIFNIAGPGVVTFEQIARQAIEVANAGNVEILESANQTASFVRFDLDINRARKAFNYSPKIELDRGLAAMCGDDIICNGINE